jgi:hypothetical protein
LQIKVSIHPRVESVTLKTTQGSITGNFLLELSFWANTVRLQIMTFFFLRADSVASPSLSYTKLQEDEAGPSLVCRRYRRWGKMFARMNEDEYYFLAGLVPSFSGQTLTLYLSAILGWDTIPFPH